MLVLNNNAFANILNVHSHIEYKQRSSVTPFQFKVYASICSASRSDSFCSNSTTKNSANSENSRNSLFHLLICISSYKQKEKRTRVACPKLSRSEKKKPSTSTPLTLITTVVRTHVSLSGQRTIVR